MTKMKTNMDWFPTKSGQAPKEYLNMPQSVMRHGKIVNILEHNSNKSVFKPKKAKG